MEIIFVGSHVYKFLTYIVDKTNINTIDFPTWKPIYIKNLEAKGYK